MKKTIIILSIFLAFLIGIGAYVGTHLVVKPLGDSGIPNIIYSPTNTSVTCNNATTSVLLASGTARSYAIFSLYGATTTNVCDASTCTATSGIQLSSGNPTYTINSSDLYIGTVSCYGSGTSTIGIIYNQ